MIGKCFFNELELEVMKMHVVMHTVPTHCMQRCRHCDDDWA
jgi:hypothetical protein